MAGEVWEQFAFTIQNGTFDGTRLQFGINQAELWKQWCELQTPYPFWTESGCSADDAGPCDDDGGIGGYWCLPNCGFTNASGNCTLNCGPNDSQMTPIDCGKLSLCRAGGVCTCTATSCDVPLGPVGTHFDLRVDGESMAGTVVGVEQLGTPSNEAIPVFLNQQF